MHIVLVHGAGGSAFSWSTVAPLLEAAGHRVSVADNPSQSLDDDIAAVRALIDGADEDALLVGHSYGGAVITNAGRHERVRGLAYVAAWAPDEGESVQGLVNSNERAPVADFFSRGPAGEWIPQDDEASRLALAWDVPPELHARGRDFRRRSADAIFTGVTGAPAWASKPSRYLLAASDQHIGPALQRTMAERAGAVIEEIDTSHSVPFAAPDAVAAFIGRAAAAL